MDYYTHLVNNAAESMIETMRHGNFLVDYFPLLKYIPGEFYYLWMFTNCAKSNSMVSWCIFQATGGEMGSFFFRSCKQTLGESSSLYCKDHLKTVP
jgi:hypothetical protein